MNIVVLAGGVSSERDVSLSSGTMVLEALRKLGHKAVLVDSFLGLPSVPQNIADVFTGEKPHAAVRVSEEAPDIANVRAQRKDSGFGEIGAHVIEVCRAADIVYMGLHGDDGENGRMQAFFDVLGVRYTGAGYLESALAMNKTVAKQLLLQQGILTPDGKAFLKGEDTAAAKELGFPCIVKPCCGGSSIGVAIAHNETELERAFEEAFRYENEVLAEAFVTGREFSVGVLGDTVLPPIEIIPRDGFYDYAHKYQAGWTEEVCPADLSDWQEEQMKQAAKAAYHALRLTVYARGEFIMDQDGRLYCLEMNTLPGMTPTSLLPQEAQAVGISYEQLCQRVIDLSVAKYEGCK